MIIDTDKVITDQKEGTGQPNVNGEKLSRIQVPVPGEDDQHRIVAYLNAFEAKLDGLRHIQAENAAEWQAIIARLKGWDGTQKEKE